MYREALPEFEKYSALSHGSAMSLALLGNTHARLRERDPALRLLDQLQAASKQSALIYTGLGEKDQALARLEKAYEERFTRLAYIRQGALWDSLRCDPRFFGLLHHMGFGQ